MSNNFGATAVVAILSALLSVALENVPGMRAWWADWPYKRLAWLIGCFAVPAAWVGLAYAGAPVGVMLPGPFIWDGLFLFAKVGIAAYYAGQFAYAVQMEKVRSDVTRELAIFNASLQDTTKHGGAH